MIIMSNNLWNRDTNSDAWLARGEDCSADARVEGLCRAYTSVMPDILGFQEMSRHMEALLMTRMNRIHAVDGAVIPYEIITGGYTPIIYRGDKLRLLESGHRIYPAEFPPFEGSFNDVDSKDYTFGVFEERATGKRIIVFSTHLWWKTGNPDKSANYQRGSAEARAFQIKTAIARADTLQSQYNCPAVIMGDLNSALGSLCLNAALDAGFEEAHDRSIGVRYEGKGHHYCYADGWRHDPIGEYDKAIDHILLRDGKECTVHSFLRFTEPFFDCLSDHFPVYIELSVGESC